MRILSKTHWTILTVLLTAGCYAGRAQTGSAPEADSVAKRSFKTGSIAITQTARPLPNGTTPFYYVLATFLDATPAKGASPSAGPAPCIQSVEDACDVVMCDALLASAAPAATTRSESAPVSIKAPSAGKIALVTDRKVLLAASKEGLYAPKLGDADFFKAGGEMTIRTEGGEVPAFEKTIAVPPPVSVTAPAWPDAGSPIALDRSQDFVVAWTGAAKGSVIATITTESEKKSVTVACKFDASKGTATIPAQTMSKLVTTTKNGSIGIDTRTAELVHAGAWAITTIANRPATVGKGLALGAVSVQ